MFLKRYEDIRKERMDRFVVDSTVCFLASCKQTERTQSIFSENLKEDYSDIYDVFIGSRAALPLADVMKDYNEYDADTDAEKQFEVFI